MKYMSLFEYIQRVRDDCVSRAGHTHKLFTGLYWSYTVASTYHSIPSPGVSVFGRAAAALLFPTTSAFRVNELPATRRSVPPPVAWASKKRVLPGTNTGSENGAGSFGLKDRDAEGASQCCPVRANGMCHITCSANGMPMRWGQAGRPQRRVRTQNLDLPCGIHSGCWPAAGPQLHTQARRRRQRRSTYHAVVSALGAHHTHKRKHQNDCRSNAHKHTRARARACRRKLTATYHQASVFSAIANAFDVSPPLQIDSVAQSGFAIIQSVLSLSPCACRPGPSSVPFGVRRPYRPV